MREPQLGRVEVAATSLAEHRASAEKRPIPASEGIGQIQSSSI